MSESTTILTPEQVAKYRKSLATAGTDIEGLIVKHLRCPEGYGIDQVAWQAKLADDVRLMGCDWLHWFFQRDFGGNVVAESVRDLCIAHELALALLAARDRTIAALREAAAADVNAGMAAVDEALKEFGYESLRFADVRNGWLCSTERLRRMMYGIGSAFTFWPDGQEDSK